MSEKDKKKFKLSYESDGKMGKESTFKHRKSTQVKDEEMFFNITQDSE